MILVVSFTNSIRAHAVQQDQNLPFTDGGDLKWRDDYKERTVSEGKVKG